MFTGFGWIVVIVAFLAACIIARYIIKRTSQEQPLIPKEERTWGSTFRARPGLDAPLPDEPVINTPIKVVISFDEKGEKFLNLDIVVIRKSLESIAKSLKGIAKDNLNRR